MDQILFALITALTVARLDVQSPPSRSGRRSLLPREFEIALARSAAPASVSANARVLIMVDSGFVIGAEGTNGVTCVVNRSWPTSLEPHCFDSEASATILPIELRRTTLYHQGKSDADVEADIGRRLADGRLRLPRRPAMSYMMSDGQQLVGEDGKPAGKWRPHVMIYYPYLTNSDVGFSSKPDMRVGMVADEAEPTSSLMLIMPQFIGVASTSR